MDELQYADKPPAGFRLASKDQAIAEGDMVCINLMARDGGWTPVRPGQNQVGNTVHALWPRVMALAVKMPARRS